MAGDRVLDDGDQLGCGDSQGDAPFHALLPGADPELGAKSAVDGDHGRTGLGEPVVEVAAVLDDKIFGTTTVAVDVDDVKLQLAKDLGADHVVDARGDQAAQLAAIRGVDVALVTVPSPQAIHAAHAALNPSGRLVIVGLPADNRLEIPVFETVLKGISVIGSLVGTRNDLHDTFALHAQGTTRVVAEGRKLEDVNACFDEVLAGNVPTRLVFDFEGKIGPRDPEGRGATARYPCSVSFGRVAPHCLLDGFV